MMWHQGMYVRVRDAEPTDVGSCANIDAHDQSAIVRQYMRYTAQIQSGKTASKQILRALQMYVLSGMSVLFKGSRIYAPPSPAQRMNQRDLCIYGHAEKPPRKMSTKAR